MLACQGPNSELELARLKASPLAAVRTRWAPGARIARGRWRMVLLARRTEQLGEDRLQPICPDLVAHDRGMKFVAGIHHAFQQHACPIRQLVIDVEIPNFLAVGKFG